MFFPRPTQIPGGDCAWLGSLESDVMNGEVGYPLGHIQKLC